MRKVVLTMKEKLYYETIKRVVDECGDKKRAALKLQLSIRQVNRLIHRYNERGKEGFVHGNSGRKPKHTLSQDTREKIVSLYKTKYEDTNFKHYKELLDSKEGIKLSTTTIRSILQEAEIISPKAQRKTKSWKKLLLREKLKKAETKREKRVIEEKLVMPELSHPSRPRAKYFGELLQMDASTHKWLTGVSEKQTLHIAVDDNTGRLLGAYFTKEETLEGYYNVLNQILTNYGIPYQFMTDRRTVFEYESKAMKKLEEDTFTQFSYACHELGIAIKTSSVPQKKGRVERMFNTLQSRLIAEMKLAQVNSIEQANKFLNSYVEAFNQQFGLQINYNTSVFEVAPPIEKINLMLGIRSIRKVDSGHHVRYKNSFYLPIDENSKEACYRKGTEVLVIESFDDKIYLSIEEKIYAVKKLESHQLTSKNFDKQPVVDKARKKYIPPIDHPWRKSSFKKFLCKSNKNLNKYDSELIA